MLYKKTLGAGKVTKLFILFAICLFCSVPVVTSAAQAESAAETKLAPFLFFPDWNIYGSNTWRSDVYKSKGNLAATPYRFSNMQSYDEINLNMDRSFTPFNRVTAQISGLIYNDSLYRSPFSGSVLERINLRQENGDFFIPYRAEVGDFFEFQSYRTIQRSLKGGRVEFQPQWGGADFQNSIELFGGTASPNWDTFQYKDDFSTGGSWLVKHPLMGTLATNLVMNHKQANGFAQPSLKQYVSSLAWEKRAALLGQRMVIEVEAGRFIGDHPVVLAGVANKRRQGNAYFTQLSGTPDILPQLSYRVRGEAYDQDYMPNGASIQSDRRSEEGYLTWRTERGLAFSSRLQHILTGRQSATPTKTVTYGGNISGIIPVLSGFSGNIDAFDSTIKSSTLTVNTVAKVVNVNLSKSINQDLSLRGGIYHANNRDKNNATSGHSITNQYTAGADMRVYWQGVTGTLSPGVIVRSMHQQGAKSWQNLNPTFNANLIYGVHQLSFALSNLDQGSQIANGGVATRTAGLNYRYTQTKYTVGLDGNWYDRQPDNIATSWTNAWHVGAYITYNFDSPARQLASAEPETVSDASTTPAAIERMLVDLSKLKPGMDANTAKAVVAAAGLGAPAEQAGLLIWYARIFRDLNENQRLVLDVRSGRVVRAAVIIDFTDSGDVITMSSTFERMRRQLLGVYGQPSEFFDQGDFTPTMPAELAAGRFIRTMEWRPTGGILRFGIPHRLDSRIRMELQFASSFPALKDTLWSMEEVQ